MVFCILLNWNGWQDTVACIQSLLEQTYSSLRIVVVDNASSDDSVARIKQAFPQIEVIDAGANLGFSGGCNIGIRAALAAGASFVWLLNNDTIAPPDTLEKLLASANSEGKIGITGTVLRYMDEPEKIQGWGGGSVMTSTGFVSHFVEPSIFGANTFLTFASVLIRAELLREIGLLDEGYFMYFEDADFCFRARRAGWKLAVAPGTAVLHKEGGSSAKGKNPGIDRISTASGLRFLSRYGTLPPVAMVLFLSSRFAKRLLSFNFAGIRAVSLGVADWWHNRTTVYRLEA